MDSVRALGCFDFDNNGIVYQHIHLEGALEPHAFVMDRHMNPLISKPKRAHFIAETLFIDRFQKPRSQVPMYFDRRADNLLSQVVLDQSGQPGDRRFLCSLRYLRSYVRLDFHFLRVRSSRLRASASRPDLIPRRGLPLEDSLQDVVLFQAVRLRVEVEQDAMAQDGDADDRTSS